MAGFLPVGELRRDGPSPVVLTPVTAESVIPPLSILTVTFSIAGSPGVIADPLDTSVVGNTSTAVANATPPLSFAVLDLVDTPATAVPTVTSSSGGPSQILWGYEAAGAAARILRYNIATGSVLGTCIPAGSLNGRGLAMDPLDGNLWYTFVTFPGFSGDGMIHKTTPPPPNGTCTPVTSIPVNGPQKDIGALDIDVASKHIWAAGYHPILVGTVLRSYLYLVDRNNGNVIQSCWIPFRGGGVGNDSLAYFRDKTLPGSGQYLLTDAGEDLTIPNSLAVIDTADCHKGQQVTPVAEFAKNHGMTGIDFEAPGLLNTDLLALYNNGNQPFASSTVIGPTTVLFLEDIAYCGFRARFGGDGNDICPYPNP
jgi:hypothetical protein